MYLAGNGTEKIKSALGKLPPGARGVRATLEIMRAFVRQYRKNPELRKVAADRIAHIPQKDFAGEANALHEFVRDHIRYMRDIHGVETVQTPAATLKFGYGDCDDKATLLATLLQATGHPTRFVAVGQEPGRYQHVYVETLIGKKWVACDGTEPHPMGWRPDKIQQTMRVHI